MNKMDRNLQLKNVTRGRRMVSFFFSLFFNGISTFVGYLMPKLFS